MEKEAERTHRRFEPEYKAKIVQEAAGLDKEKTRKLLEREGLQPWHLAHWKREIQPAGNSNKNNIELELKKAKIELKAAKQLLKLKDHNGFKN